MCLRKQNKQNTNRKCLPQGTVDHVSDRVNDGAGRGDRRMSDGLDRLDGDVGSLAVIAADALLLVDGGIEKPPQMLQQPAVGLQRLRSQQFLQKMGEGRQGQPDWGNMSTCLRLLTAINQREMMRQMEKASKYFLSNHSLFS